MNPSLLKNTVLIITLFASGLAQAGLIRFDYRSALESTAIQGTSLSDTYELSILMDNGSDELTSQDWLISDIIAVNVVIGSYTASFVDSFWQPLTDIVFSTNASGFITFSDFEGTMSSTSHKDIFGTGVPVYLYGNGIRSFNRNTAVISDYGLRLEQNWQYTPVEVPAPGVFALFMAAAGLVCLRRRTSFF